MSKEFSELKRRLDVLTNLHLRALGTFNAYETILKLLAPNVVGEAEAKGYQAAMNRYKGFFNTAKRAYEYEMLMTLARIFVAHKDALYLERLVNYAEQNRKKLSVDDFKEYHEDNAYLSELAASYEGLNNDDLKAIRQDLENMRDPIERLKTLRDQSLAHTDFKPFEGVNFKYQELADLIALSEKILNTLSKKHFMSEALFTVYQEEVVNDITGVATIARMETEHPREFGELMDSFDK